MSTITETLEGLQTQVLDAIKTVQEPTVDAVHKVAETVEGFLPEDRPSAPFADRLPNPADLVDTLYGYAAQLLDGQHDFAKAVLANQHEFAKAIVEALAPVLPEAPKVATPAKPKVAKAA
jgi:hypothetical protein